MRHDPAAIWAHTNKVLHFLKEQNPGLTTLHVVSDGPTTQYRSKKNFFLLSTLPFEMGWTKVTWNFMEAGHGKGPADGVGAAVKQKADRMVAMGKDISSPKTLFNELLASKTNIKLFFIENEEIDAIDALLPDDLQTVRGTMTIHQIVSESPGVISWSILSCFCSSPNGCSCFDPQVVTFQKDDRLPSHKAHQHSTTHQPMCCSALKNILMSNPHNEIDKLGHSMHFDVSCTQTL
ncbi:unnamed protein product [Leuciscus chuanchicus]